MSIIIPVGPVIGTERIIWQIVGANMNSTADQAFTKVGTFTNFIITHLRVVNASTSLTLAAGGIYPTTSKGGTPLVAASQVYSTLTGATLGLELTVAAAGLGLRTDANLYLALTTAQGGAATTDFYMIGIPLS